MKSVKNDRYWPMVIFLFCLGVQLLQSLLSFNGFYQTYPDFMHAGTWLLFANGPATWLMLSSPNRKSQLNTWIHFLPCLIAFIWLLSFYQLETNIKPQIYFSSGFNKMAFWLLFLIHWFLYLVVLVISSVRSSQKVSALFLMVVLFCGVYIFSSLITWIYLVVNHQYLYILDMISLTALVVLVAGITFLHVMKANHLIKSADQGLSIPLTIMTSRFNQLVEQQAMYRKPELSLNELAGAMNCSPRVLSTWFNQHLNTSFKRWLNERRIKDAKELIKNHSAIPVSTLGYQVGYNSSASFYRAFKQVTGQSPGEYKKSIELVY